MLNVPNLIFNFRFSAYWNFPILLDYYLLPNSSLIEILNLSMKKLINLLTSYVLLHFYTFQYSAANPPILYSLKTQKNHWRCSGVFTVNFEHIFTPCFSVSIVNFEQINTGWVDVFKTCSNIYDWVIFQNKFKAKKHWIFSQNKAVIDFWQIRNYALHKKWSFLLKVH